MHVYMNIPGCHTKSQILSLPSLVQAGELQLLIRKAQSMLSDKHVLPTEEKEHVDKESKRDRADQIHIYLQLTDLFSKINSHICWYFSL